MFKFAPEVKVGTIFKRIDRNGKVWEAKVINRTEYFVDVEKTQPYQIKVGDEWGWHYEDAAPTYERAEIKENYDYIETGETEKTIWGNIPKKKKVKLNYYSLHLKEDYSRSWKYDKTYCFQYKDAATEDAKIGLDLFYKYCEEN